MAEARAFPFTACVDHLNLTFREFVTLPAPNFNFKQEKYAQALREVLPEALREVSLEGLREALREGLPEALREGLPEALREVLPEALQEFLNLSSANCNFELTCKFIPDCNFKPEKYSSAFREFVTLSATTCTFESEKSLEERQAEVAIIREKHPDLIPVIILQAEGSQMQYPDKKKLLILAKDNLGVFFLSIWRIFYKLEFMSETHSLHSIVEHKDPIFEKLMSSVYEEYKDEDGCLYITLSGEKKNVLTEPIPCNIKTWTLYYPKQGWNQD